MSCTDSDSGSVSRICGFRTNILCSNKRKRRTPKIPRSQVQTLRILAYPSCFSRRWLLSYPIFPEDFNSIGRRLQFAIRIANVANRPLYPRQRLRYAPAMTNSEAISSGPERLFWEARRLANRRRSAIASRAPTCPGLARRPVATVRHCSGHCSSLLHVFSDMRSDADRSVSVLSFH